MNGEARPTRTAVDRGQTTRTPAGPCVYCGRVRRLTRDHVPPKALFPSPRPTNLITVPACSPCNDSFKRDDEYFMLFALTQATLDPAWETFARQKLATRSPGLRRKLRSSIRQVDLTTPAGLPFDRREGLAFEKTRVNRVLERIIRGLTWHYYQTRLPDDVTLTVRPHTELGVAFLKIVDLVRETTVVDSRGGVVFQYRWGRAVEDPDQSLWILSFYNRNNPRRHGHQGKGLTRRRNSVSSSDTCGGVHALVRPGGPGEK